MTSRGNKLPGEGKSGASPGKSAVGPDGSDVRAEVTQETSQGTRPSRGNDSASRVTEERSRGARCNCKGQGRCSSCQAVYEGIDKHRAKVVVQRTPGGTDRQIDIAMTVKLPSHPRYVVDPNDPLEQKCTACLHTVRLHSSPAIGSKCSTCQCTGLARTVATTIG